MKTKYVFILLFVYLGIKKDSVAQNYVWAKSLVGRGVSTLTNLTPGRSNAEAIAVDTLGNIYITGFCNDTVDFDPGPNEVLLDAGNDDIFIAKYDAQGNYLWAHVFWSPGWNYGMHLKLDHQGNIIIAGHAQSLADFDPGPNQGFLGNTATANYIFMAKYDANGNFIWAHDLGNNFGAFIGSLDVDHDNNIHITGHFYGSMDMDPDTSNSYIVSNQTGIFVAKYTPNGAFVWANSISGIGNLGESKSIVCGNNGNIYVAGIFGNTVDFDPSVDTFLLTANTTCDRFFLKYNSLGNLIWAKRIDVNEDGMLFVDRMIKIALDDAENVYLTGNFSGTVDFNPAAAVYNIVTPMTTSSYICKFTTSGHFLWAKALIGGVVQTTDIVLDCSSNICLAGSFGSGDFDPSANVYPFSSAVPSAFNNFYAKYNNDGDFVWVKQIGNNGYAGSTLGISMYLSQGYLYLAGGFKQVGNFNPDGTATIQSQGVDQNAFFAKYQYLNFENILHDTLLCQGQNVTLDVSAFSGSYQWHDQSTQATYQVSQSGTYWVNISLPNCKIIDSCKVQYHDMAPLAQQDTTICLGEQLTIQAQNNNAQFLWQDQTSNSSITVQQAGTYWVTITQGYCSITDTVIVETKACETIINYPNVFTPNIDGVNEAFIPIKMQGIYNAQLSIYSRWGQKIFETNNLQQGWDGKLNDKLVSSGVYYWILDYTDINQNTSNLKGFVTLLN